MMKEIIGCIFWIVVSMIFMAASLKSYDKEYELERAKIERYKEELGYKAQ